MKHEHKFHLAEKGYRMNMKTGLTEMVYEFVCEKCGKVKFVKGVEE